MVLQHNLWRHPMKVMLRLLALLVTLSGFSFPSWAASDKGFYGIVGVGSSRLQENDHPPKDREYTFRGERIRLGISAQDDGESTVTQLGIGYRFNRFLDVQFGHLRGFGAKRSYEATLQVSGEPTRSVRADCLIEMDGYELSLIPAWPVAERFSLTARVGAFFGRGTARVEASFLPSGYAIETERRRETLPVVGLGIRYQAPDSIGWTLEHIGVNQKYRLIRVALLIPF